MSDTRGGLTDTECSREIRMERSTSRV